MNLLDAINVNVSRGRRPILHDISLTLQPGEIIALLGPNGSGKSTLLATLIGYLRGSGTIYWQGTSIDRLARQTRASLVALLPQTPVFPSDLSVRQFLAMGRTSQLGWFGLESPGDITIVNEVIRDLDLLPFATKPLGRLSGGERQRILIGRALVQQPRALLLDEPDTFLDLRQQQSLGRLLGNLATQRGLGILLASHDLNFAMRIADRFLLLKEGRSIDSGAIESLNPEKLSDAFDVAFTKSPQLTVQA